MELDQRSPDVSHLGTPRRQFLIAGAGILTAIVAGGALDIGLAHAVQPWPITGQVGDIGPFEILSYSWASSSGNGKAKKDHVTFVKNLDGSSSALSSATAGGQLFATATIAIEGNGGKLTTYLMSDVMITAYTAAGTTETVTLQFASLKTVRR